MWHFNLGGVVVTQSVTFKYVEGPTRLQVELLLKNQHKKTKGLTVPPKNPVEMSKVDSMIISKKKHPLTRRMGTLDTRVGVCWLWCKPNILWVTTRL